MVSLADKYPYSKYERIANAFLTKNNQAMLAPLNETAIKVIKEDMFLSLEIWDDAIHELKTIEKELNLVYRINEGMKLFALDGIVISNALGINKSYFYNKIKAFVIYYLAIHFIDDFIEDHKKFNSKFYIDGGKKLDKDGAILSFIFSVSLGIFNILCKEKHFDKHIKFIYYNMAKSMAKQVRYFVYEKDKGIGYKKVLKIKNREVSGIATSFMADFLFLESYMGIQKTRYIKTALLYLGSLTQFTDDLRDFYDDIDNGNANILVSLKTRYGKSFLKNWARLYYNDEKKMLYWFNKAGITDSDEVIRTIPFFFLFE